MKITIGRATITITAATRMAGAGDEMTAEGVAVVEAEEGDEAEHNVNAASTETDQSASYELERTESPTADRSWQTKVGSKSHFFHVRTS